MISRVVTVYISPVFEVMLWIFNKYTQDSFGIKMSILEYSEKFVHAKSLEMAQHCTICPYFTTSFFLMVNHVKQHDASSILFKCERSNLETYYCKDCNFETDLTLPFKLHIEKHSNTGRKYHEDIPYNIQNYACANCGFETHFSVKWLQHTAACLRSTENNKNKRIKCYRCDRCDFKTRYKPSLRRHKFFKHVKHCTKCLFTPMLNNDLWSHLNSHHLNKEDVPVSMMCLKDKEDSETLTCVSDAETVYTSNKNDHCERSYKHKHSLNIHKTSKFVNAYELIWYYCAECPFKTHDTSSLEFHENVHHVKQEDIKWYKCSHCPYKSKFPPNLITHMNLHHLNGTDIKWYECKKCLYKTKKYSQLQNHVISRHLDAQNIKWHKCDKCSYKAKLKTALKFHINCYHVGDEEKKLQKCNKCQYKAKSLYYLKKHMRAHHFNKPEVKWHECDQCKYRSKFACYLKKHKDMCHSGPENINGAECPNNVEEKPFLKSHINEKMKRILNNIITHES